MTEFDCFIGVDWSGNRSNWQKGLQVAIATPGATAPVLERGKGPKGRWSRESFAEWLAQKIRRERVLVGLDFAFGFPDTTLVAPGLTLNWHYVAELCRADRNFYGGRFFKEANALHASLINSASVKGQSYSANWLRRTEIAAKCTKGATPQCVFNAIGAAQVGPSSISGMRFLHHMTEHHKEKMAIWPFEALDHRSIIVEVFPRFFPLSKGLSPRLADHQVLNLALEAFGSSGVDHAPENEDEGDALLTAAALRNLSQELRWFDLPPVSKRDEGWIFGVPFI